MMAKILLVHSNRSVAERLADDLRLEGHVLQVAQHGHEAIVLSRREEPDLLILDLDVGGLSGCTVLRAVRRESVTLPVLVLSGLEDSAQRIIAFDLGADGWVPKPCSPLELLARINAFGRKAMRLAGQQTRKMHRFGDVCIDPGAREVHRRGVPIELSPRAFELLLALVRKAPDAVTRPQLLAEVWGHRGAVQTRTIDQHVRELRIKLEEDPANPRHILAVPKIGYRMRLE